MLPRVGHEPLVFAGIFPLSLEQDECCGLDFVQLLYSVVLCSWSPGGLELSWQPRHCLLCNRGVESHQPQAQANTCLRCLFILHFI